MTNTEHHHELPALAALGQDAHDEHDTEGHRFHRFGSDGGYAADTVGDTVVEP